MTYVKSGALAGAVSALVFALVHALFISDIWFSAIAMTIAGAICGMGVGWTYGLLFRSPSVRTWIGYNLTYLGMFVLLGVISVVVFEPVTTVAALIEESEPLGELFGRAMPLTVVFTGAMAATLTLLFGRSWKNFGAILITSSVLIALLGLNVSTIGLVAIPRGSIHLVAELFGLIFILNAVFVGVFVALERQSLLAAPRPAREPAAIEERQ